MSVNGHDQGSVDGHHQKSSINGGNEPLVHETNTLLSKLVAQLEADPRLPVDNPTKSYWQQPACEDFSDLHSSDLPTSTDVLIIGSGITGCSVARQLLQSDASISVVMLDARGITSGATGRNGGHIKAVPEVSYADLLPMIGKEKAQEVVQFTLANVEELFRVSEGLSPELRRYSEVRRVESLNIFTDKEGIARARATVQDFDADNAKLKGRMRVVEKEELRRKYGIQDASGGAVATAGAAWPYRLITGMLSDLLTTYGTRFSIRPSTPVQAISFSNGEYLVQTTARPQPIRATHIVHATNGHAGHLLPGLRGRLFPVRGQMTAQTPHPSFGTHGGSQSWSIAYSKGFDYITQSGNTGEIFIGGGLARSHPLHELGNPRDDENAVLSIAHLGGIMDATFGRPVRGEIKAAWTGVMGFTADGLPMVGRLSQAVTGRGGEREWLSAGYNGYGMANAWLCGKRIADLVLGRGDEAQTVPSAYVLTDERLAALSAEDAARYWLSLFKLE